MLALRALKLFTITGLMLLLGACAAPAKPIEQPSFQPTMLSFEYFIRNSPITDKEIINQLKDAIFPAMAVVPEKKYYPNDSQIWPINGMELFSQCNDNGSCNLKAVYTNGDIFIDTEGKILTKDDKIKFFSQLKTHENTTSQVIDIPVKLNRQGQKVIVTVHLSGIAQRISPFPVDHYFAKPMLLKAKDIDAVFTAVAALRPTIKAPEIYKDELNLAEANDVIVYSNFLRTFGLVEGERVGTKMDIGLASLFELKTSRETAPLWLKIYPTRTGALALYNFKVFYTLTPDGKGNYDDEMIEAARRTIEETAKL